MSALGLCAAAQGAGIGAAAAAARKVYRDPAGRVSFSYPSAWKARVLQPTDYTMATLEAEDGAPVTGLYVSAPGNTSQAVRFVYRLLPGLDGRACRSRFQSMAGSDADVMETLVNGENFFAAKSGTVATGQTFGAQMLGIAWRGNCLIFEGDANTGMPGESVDANGGGKRSGNGRDQHVEAALRGISRSIKLW